MQTSVHQGCTSIKEIPHEIWRVEIGNRKLTLKFGNIIRDHISHKRMRTHLSSKGSIDWRSFNTINWEAIGHMMQDSTVNFKIWISKHVSEFVE